MIEQSVSLASNGVVKVPGYEQLVRFGYTKNRSVYRLAVTASGEWEGLAIRAFWHLPGGGAPASTLVKDGSVAVPASVTAQPGNGCVTFEGSDGTKTVTSADLRYRVSANSGTEDGTMPEPGTPAWQELVDAVHTDATAAEQAKTDAQTAAQQAGASAKKAGQALSDTITAKEDALKAIGDKQTTATQAVDIARDKALQQVEASTEAAQTAASEAATSAGNADQSAQKAADSLRELKDGIANGNFKGEPGNDGKSPVVTVTDIENGHRVSITDKDGTKTIDVLNGKDGKDAPQIDDATVTDSAPWSSKHIIDMLCPPLEESGNPVVCYPVAGYALGVKAMWEPAQEGTGTPSPENIRPIKGRDSVTVDRCGENVIEFLSTEDSSSDIKIAVDAEKNITLNGTLAEKGNITIGTCRLHWVAGKTYTMYVKKVGGSVSLVSGDGITFAYALFTTDYNHFFRGGTNSTNLDVYIASDAALVETELVFMLQCWRKGTVFNNFKFQIEVVEGTTTPSTYTPYIGQTNTLTLPKTVYGGTVDAVTGEGQETYSIKKIKEFDSINVHANQNRDWVSAYSVWEYINGEPNKKYISNLFKVENWNDFSMANKNVSMWYANTTFGMALSKKAFNISDATTDDEILNIVKKYLASLSTELVIAYKLATPTPFTATGAQPIPALSGVNTILTDADSVTVTGRADPIKRITDLEDAVASMTNT